MLVRFCRKLTEIPLSALEAFYVSVLLEIHHIAGQTIHQQQVENFVTLMCYTSVNCHNEHYTLNVHLLLFLPVYSGNHMVDMLVIV